MNVEAKWVGFGPNCMKEANVLWATLNDRENYEIVLVHGPNGENGRAVVPLYSQCVHPSAFENKGIRSVKKTILYNGKVVATLYSLTGSEYSIRNTSSNIHKKCSCWTKNKSSLT